MITLDEAIEYFKNERLFSETWLGLPTKVQEQSLNMAKNQISNIKLNSCMDELREANIKKAICEQALFLYENSQRQKLINQGVTSFSVEGLSESYDLAKARNSICVEAREFLKPYMLGCVFIC